MVKFGYKLMTEEHGPKALIENAVAAEAAGFDFVSISDHFHPWLEAQGHAPFAWSVLGAIAHGTSRVGITTGLTCPIIRYHPAIIAQAAATISLISGGRFSLAVGAGERLNEHVTGARWPSIPERHDMLGEAIDILRALWTGGVQNHAGDHFVVDHARLYDAPEGKIPILVGASGAASGALAAEKGDGLMTTEPNAELVKAFRTKKPDGPCYAEAAMAVAETEEAGRRLAHERFKFSAFEWSVNSEVPSVEGFEAACKYVRPEDLAGAIPAGPDPEPYVESVRKYVEAGFDHVALTGVGPDQKGFIAFFKEKLAPRLKALG
jgi:G6PDH family F420-dependent oxidoreductase